MNENPLNRLEALAQKARQSFCAEYRQLGLGEIEWHQLSPYDRAAWVAVVRAIRGELRRDADTSNPTQMNPDIGRLARAAYRLYNVTRQDWDQLDSHSRAGWWDVAEGLLREFTLAHEKALPRLWHRVRKATGEPLTTACGPSGPTGNPWDTSEWVLVEPLGPPLSPNWVFVELTREACERGQELWFPIASGPNGPSAMDAPDGASSDEEEDTTAY